jgi:hypothetical protein
MALALSLRDLEISDFPLTTKANSVTAVMIYTVIELTNSISVFLKKYKYSGNTVSSISRMSPTRNYQVLIKTA